jgi:hypothetical protein
VCYIGAQVSAGVVVLNGVNPGAVRCRTRERRHIAPRSTFLLIKPRVPVSAEALPFHPPSLRLLLFPANPSSSYNPFAFESKRTWGMRKKKTFSPIFSFKLWQRNKDLNSFLMTNSISVSFCIGCSDDPLRVFLLHASVILRFVLFLFVCNQGCGEILIFLFQVRVVRISDLSSYISYYYWYGDKCLESVLKLATTVFFSILSQFNLYM